MATLYSILKNPCANAGGHNTTVVLYNRGYKEGYYTFYNSFFLLLRKVIRVEFSLIKS